MTRIASQPFVLTLANGDKRAYKLGERIEAEHCEHWWAKAHSAEFDQAAEDARRAEEAAKAGELERLKDEVASLMAENKRGAADLRHAQEEIEKLKAERDALKAELAAGTPGADQTKDGGKKKG